MGDPFSTSAGIAGLISLGLTLGNGLHTYFSAIKDRHSDIEIAQQSLGLLQFNICILRSNQSRLSRRHGLAADGLTLGVINCEAQLRSLEVLLNELTSTEGSTALKQTLRKQKMIARYPFDQKKLVQLQDQLSKANATLNNFLSTLILESVLDISKDMEALKILSEARGTSTQTIPKVMAPQLNIIAPKEERGTLAIVSHSARIREQLPTISNDTHTQPHYLQNTEFETRFCANAAASVCTCRASANNTAIHSFNKWQCLTSARHILDIVTHFRGLWLLPRLYGLIADRDRGFYSTELAHRQQHYYYGLSENGQMIEPLDAFCKYPEMSADLGFSDLFLTVINKDLWKLQAMLKDRAIDTKILQKDLYRRNILHASTDWPAGLKALLEHETVVCPLMNDLSSFGFTPLDHALCYSKYQCNAPDQWTVCYNCACFVPAQLLLEADCSVTIGWYRHKTLRNCSLRARMLFFQHMKNRRERLRQISIRVLPSTFLERYQIDAQSLPDATAMVLWDELQKKKYERLRLAVGFSDSLEPHCGINPSSCRRFFGHLHHWKVAILACTYGFQPRDEHGVPTLLSRDLQGGCDEIEDFITYIDWLLQFNLELELYLGPFQLSALHRLAAILGNRIKHLLDDGESFPDSILTRTHVLFSAICSDESQSNVPCPCISRMFNRPVCYLISGMTAYSWVSDTERFWENIHRTIDHVMLMLDLIENSTRGPGTLYLFKCTVHSLTMMCLDVRHLPICYARHSDPEVIMDLNLPECRQEWTEILDEGQWLIDRLNALDEEFSTAFERENVSIADFLRGYWLERMEEVIRDLHKPLTDQDRCDLHAIGVVLNEEETVN
ncbi:hypothetical protein BKA60DRAFT_472037 [Fusarium oxysporum]|nr:hypothetical protein BKA60DRAFT_472037 [Fusarium oxysporum]